MLMLPLLEKRAVDPVKTWRLCFQLDSAIAALPSMKQDSLDCFKCVVVQVRPPVMTLFAPCFFKANTLSIYLLLECISSAWVLHC